jgi:outer membrane protein TolC
MLQCLLACIASVLTLVGSRTAASGADNDPPLSLDQVVQQALARNPGLKAAHQRWQAAMARIPQAVALPDPRLTYTYYLEEVETRVGPQRQSLGLAQTFPWFGKRELRESRASRNAEAAWEELETERLRIVFEVASAVCELVYTDRAAAIARENFDLLENLEAVVRQAYRTGQDLTPLSRVQLEMGRVEERLETLIDTRDAVLARVNASLNRRPDEPLLFDGLLPYRDRDPGTAETLALLVPERNPSLRRVRRLTDGDRDGVRLARLNRFPDVTLGLTAVDTREARMPGVSDSGKDPLMLSVSLNLPIWGGPRRAELEEAAAVLGARQMELEDSLARLQARVEQVRVRLRTAVRKVDLYTNSLLPKAEEGLRIAQQAYESGRSEFLNVIEAQRLLLEFALARERAVADLGIAWAELDMLAAQDHRSPAGTADPEGASDDGL